MDLLDDDWLARVADCALEFGPAVGDLVLRVEVSGAPSGTRVWHVRFAEGRVANCGSDPLGDTALTLTTTWADAQRMARGELGANTAYMQGRLKTDGPTGPLLGLLAVLGTDPARGCLAELAQATDGL